MIYYLDYSPDVNEPIVVLTDEDFFCEEISPDHHFEAVMVPGDFASEEELRMWVAEQNKEIRE